MYFLLFQLVRYHLWWIKITKEIQIERETRPSDGWRWGWCVQSLWVSGWACQPRTDHSSSTRVWAMHAFMHAPLTHSSARVAPPTDNTPYCVRQFARHARRPRLMHLAVTCPPQLTDHATDHWPWPGGPVYRAFISAITKNAWQSRAS